MPSISSQIVISFVIYQKIGMLPGELFLSSIIIVAKYGNKNTFIIQRDMQHCI
jgi:hypothetical protein